MLPPDTTDIKAAADLNYERDRRDAAAYRLIGQAGWTLVRTSELQELNDTLADLMAVCQATARKAE
jgi:hypothetical protein